MQHFLAVRDFTKDELHNILELSRTIHHIHGESLRQKNILFCFEKPSLRTKVGTEVAINQLGGKVIHVSPMEFLGGKIMYAKPIEGFDERESLKDTVNNVSRWCDAIFARVYDHNTLVNLSGFSSIPVVNALSDLHHPMQALADAYTIHQHLGQLEEVNVTYIGDANNVARSLIEICLTLGANVSFSGPEKFSWTKKEVEYFAELSKSNNAHFEVFHQPEKAVKDSDVLYTDTFVSMGEEDQYQSKMGAFDGFQVNEELMSIAKPHAGFMHCLPAHRGKEVSDGVMDSSNSWVYDQAENRMIVSKGVFTHLLSKK